MLPEWQIQLIEAQAAIASDRIRKVMDKYRRIAEELAGPDETLQRILRARLWDAYFEGLYDDVAR